MPTQRSPRPPAPRPRAPLTAAGLLLTALLALGALAGPAAAASRLGDRTLQRGATGPDVRELQRTLRRLDLAVGVDGRFGPATLRAVRRYERRTGLPADGRVSPGQARGMRARAGTLPLGGRALRRGASGKDVRRLQQLLVALGLQTPVDGRYGAGTEAAVKVVQRRTGQRADGRLTRAQAQGFLAVATAAMQALGSTLPPADAPAGAASGRFPIDGPHRYGAAGTAFGERGGRHQGVDVFADCGTRLVAPVDAKVRRVASEADAGHYVVLRAVGSGEDLVLMHLRRRATVDVGDRVPAGTAIGQVGETGNADGCHLHFEIWTAPGWYTGGSPRDPQPDLDAWTAR
ncbi:endolysin [Paraconexibacter sp. AEG42_29]|uniref:Endolysin n=1 Tax=Paraconexibacter sp. AEG42_29 TaxID=2997339 RepID=A0AAU7AZX3_9ACTN